MNFTLVKENLEKKGYIVSCFETAADAKKYLLSKIKNKTVGIGGSVTIQELGLYGELAENNTVFWHWEINEGKTAKEILSDAKNAEIYLSSANGIAETGEIINIDGTGNRVAAISYGHEKVYIIAGKNKIEADCDKALYRARNIASPLNAKRLNRKTPCAAKADKCYDCASAERICRNLSILYTKPTGAEYEIILINENLGY